MQRSVESKSYELMLFDSKALRWARGSVPKQSLPNLQTATQLEPVWKTASGEYIRCSYELVWRWFARTRIHDRKFTYNGQSRLDPSSDYSDQEGHYFINRLPDFLSGHWPAPKEGGLVYSLSQPGVTPRYCVTIYCDHLFLCNRCGKFYGQSDDEGRPPWIVDGLEINHVALRQYAEARKNRPEFEFRPCRRHGCEARRERTLTQMQQNQQAAFRRAAYNTAVLDSARLAPAPTTAETRGGRAGFVYVAGGKGWYKIGMANDVLARISTLQTACPFRLAVVNAWRVHHAARAEALLHRKYREFRCSGEWFSLSEEEVRAVESADSLDQLLT